MELLVYGVDPDALSDREKERLAVHVHEYLQEEFDVHPDTVGVEGYRGEGAYKQEGQIGPEEP